MSGVPSSRYTGRERVFLGWVSTSGHEDRSYLGHGGTEVPRFKKVGGVSGRSFRRVDGLGGRGGSESLHDQGGDSICLTSTCVTGTLRCTGPVGEGGGVGTGLDPE